MPGKLGDILLKDGVRNRVIEDSVGVIDQEVADRGGLTGLAIKGAYSAVKALKKGFVRDAVDGLIDDFVTELEPFYADFEKQGSGTFADYLAKNKSRVADGLLRVTDRRRDRTSWTALKKVYDKVRGIAQANVEQSLPRVGRMIQKHLDAATA